MSKIHKGGAVPLLSFGPSCTKICQNQRFQEADLQKKIVMLF